MLTVLDTVPEDLLKCDANMLHTVLDGPTLIHLSGRRQQPLFVSVLLHGNETTGWHAVRNLLNHYAERLLPRSLSIFIGNVKAAQCGKRFLDDQPDYNRIWKLAPGVDVLNEHKMMQEVLEALRQRDVFASIDIHNNTGLNPHYGCVTALRHASLHLASMFSRTVVYFTYPDTVQSAAFADLCPAVTVECGQPGQAYGENHASEFLKACLNLSEHPQHPVAAHDIDLFHTVAVAKIPDHIAISFNAGEADLHFVEDIDYFNFRELPVDTTLARVASDQPIQLEVRDAQGDDVSDKYFRVTDGELRTALPVMPSMLCKSVQAIRQDCFCYLMERHQSFLDLAQ